MSRRAAGLCAAWAALLWAGHVRAFDSRCYTPSLEKCEEGPGAAKGRWIGRYDEHRQLFDSACTRAGIPPMEDFQLEVFTASDASLQPTNFGAARARHGRQRRASEFAHLPDFSFSLWDWALGNETCPLTNRLSTEKCHAFAGHMGMVNSNHFVPQTQSFYAYYHRLAVERAGACATLANTLRARPDLEEYPKACETEAFVLEAIAQHYLADSWSSGHMWERWGSPDLEDFVDGDSSYPLQGLAVALTSGLIHGARSTFQPDDQSTSDLWGWYMEGIDVNDALCAPVKDRNGNDVILWTDTPHPEDDEIYPGLGDMYLSRLSEPRYSEQQRRLYDCATAGLLEVYRAAGHTSAAVPRVNPAGNECHNGRMTNLSMHWGLGVDYTDAEGEQQHLVLEPDWAARAAFSSLPAPAQAAVQLLTYPYRRDLARISAKMKLEARKHPTSTATATGLDPLLDMPRNSTFAHKSPPARYVDPELPWTSADDERATALARTFHQSHAEEWCEVFNQGSTVDNVDQVIDAVQSAANQAEKDVACAVCGELVRRHLRVETPQRWDTAREPLCQVLDPPAKVVYQEDEPAGADLRELALRRCSCLPCGHEDEPCCVDDTCRSSDLVCDAGKCKRCGASTQPCCAGNTCDGTLVCTNGTCGPCGGPNQRCCFGPEGGLTCGAELHCSPEGRCKPCGKKDVACCSGNVCDEGLRCAGGTCADCPSCGKATSWGDPHLVTLDHLLYDFQSTGEFVLFQNADLTVQVRQQVFASNPRVAINTAVAAAVGTHRIGFYVDEPRSVRVDGASLALPMSMSLTGGGSVTSELGSEGPVVVIRSAEGSVLRVTQPGPGRLDVGLFVDPSKAGTCIGLLGNFNGAPADDLALRDGTVLTQPVPNADLYGTFARSWRIDDAESLFDYAEGQGPETFIVPGFPSLPATLSTLSQAEYDAAKEVCLAAGVTNPDLLDTCILDVAVTGDSSYAKGAAAATPPAVVQIAHYSQDFEGPLGPEWSVQIKGVTPGSAAHPATHFMGPMTNGSGTLTLRHLAPHTKVRIVSDLYVIGAMDGQGPDLFRATVVDGPTYMNTTFALSGGPQAFPGTYPQDSNPPRTGATENDTLGYARDAVFRLEYEFEHSAEDLVIQMTVSGLSAGELFGLDNIDVTPL